MKRLLLALLLFSSPVVAQEYTIYTRERPPFSISGIIDADKTVLLTDEYKGYLGMSKLVTHYSINHTYR